jgi:GTPase Era involved in 16S rRNA processing
LKAEVERAFKFCSRIRGKKTEALALNELAQSKIDEFLEDDVVDSADKRGRDEADGDDEHQSKKAKKAKVSALSPEDKAHLREIANKLSKNAEADPFLYPVDKRYAMVSDV